MYTWLSIYLHIRELEIIKEFFRLYKTEVTGKATVSVKIYNYYFFEKFPISDIKSLDFKEVANIIKIKKYLTDKD